MKKVAEAWYGFLNVFAQFLMVVMIIGTIGIFAFAGCALFKGALRSVSDLAESVCDIFGTEEAAAEMSVEELCTPVDGLDGFSLAEFCAVHKPLSPFIRRILAADAEGCAGYGADVDSLGLGL